MIQLRILQAFVYLIIIFLHEKFDIHQMPLMCQNRVEIINQQSKSLSANVCNFLIASTHFKRFGLVNW